jgi:probable sporulation protein (polysaccharide deacetylase family)
MNVTGGAKLLAACAFARNAKRKDCRTMQKKLFVLIGVFWATWTVIQWSGINDYILNVKGKVNRSADREAVAVFAPMNGGGSLNDETLRIPEEDEQLRRMIQAAAEERRIEPVDAKVDSVWKAIPGYNGLTVDEEETFKLAKEGKPGNPLRLLMKELPPKVNLEDLGPYPIYKGNPQKPMVSLMINVAWGEQYLPAMLDILDKEKVQSTFFFDGSWLSKHIVTAQEIKKRGHELSNHAYSHKNMSRLSRSQATQEIVKTQKLLEQELGVHNTLFAPPSGDFDQETVDIAHDLKLKTVLWTLDTLDWRNPAPDSIVRKIASRVEPGTLILMHPTPSSSRALEAMIKEIKRKGLALGTVSELLSPRRVPSNDTPTQF